MLVNFLKPTMESRFPEYVKTIFVPKVTKELQTLERIDIFFDMYKKGSLKRTTLQKGDTGIRRKMEEQSHAPKYWHSFLRIDKNKTELFRFFLKQITTNIETSKIVVAAFEDRVLTLNDSNVGTLS